MTEREGINMSKVVLIVTVLLNSHNTKVERTYEVQSMEVCEEVSMIMYERRNELPEGATVSFQCVM